jgi:type IV pilus assembly protein PilM
MNWFIKKHKNVLGVDISTVAVKLIELSKSGSYYKVESYAISPFQPSSGESTLTNSNVITDALKTAIYSSKTTLKTANIAVSGSAVITKIISIPCSLTDSEMEEQIMIEADQYIPYSLDEVNFDFEVQGVNKNNPEIVDVLLVISRREIVNYRVDALTKVGLKASIVDVDTFAMENAFPLLPNYLPHSNDSLTVAIADIGATLSTLTILHNGRVIYTRDQDFGGQQTILHALLWTFQALTSTRPSPCALG